MLFVIRDKLLRAIESIVCFIAILACTTIVFCHFQVVKMNEDDTTSSSRIFVKQLFLELAEYMGLPKLNDRLRDE